jgi:hypothetical protein
MVGPFSVPHHHAPEIPEESGNSAAGNHCCLIPESLAKQIIPDGVRKYFQF